MRIIFEKIDKEAINEMERALFEGRIEVIQSEYEAERAVDYLLTQPILGFDTETKPQFQRGHSSLVSLLQVSSQDVCFLFRLNAIGLPECLRRLLSDEGPTLKIGLSWHDDICGLRRREEFQPGTFIEIQQIAKEMGLKDMSLQKLYANLLEGRISKTQRLSNWEADILSEAQKRYAATDAWACIQLYEEMMQLRREGYLLQMMPVYDEVKPMEYPAEEPQKQNAKADPPTSKPKATRKTQRKAAAPQKKEAQKASKKTVRTKVTETATDQIQANI